MNALRTAIYNKFIEETGGSHNSFYTLLNGNLYYDHVPQSTAYPYAIFFFVSDNTDWTFREKFDYYLVQFTIFDSDASPTDLETAYAALTTLFDDAALTISGYSAVWCTRQYSTGPMWFEEEGVWQIAVRYSILLQDT